MRNKDRINFEIKNLRLQVLEMAYRSSEWHLASSFSVAEIIFMLYLLCINTKKSDFILSKGHAAPMLYSVLSHFSHIPHNHLDTFCTNGSSLIAHTTNSIKWIQVATGSLWMGLSVGIWFSIANRASGNNKKTFVLLWDGELNEGSIWEWLLFAGSNNIKDIIAIVDFNKIQASNFCDSIIKTTPMFNAAKSLGWRVLYLDDGHDTDKVASVLKKAIDYSWWPMLIVSNSIKWKGVDFMENNPEWHHKVLSEKEYISAKKQLSYDQD